MTSATGMVPAIASVLVLALLAGVIAVLWWRLALTSARRRLWPQRDTPHGQAHPAFSYGLRGVSPGSLPLFGENPLNNGVRVPHVTKEQRAEAFLQRILALTGAKRANGAYVLNVGKVQFQLRDRFIRRLQNPDDPKSPYEETCFYLVHNGMPKVEEIATALLHLSNNPGLFDKWALQNGVAFKADGKVFDRCPLMGLR
jgi:hypothetical protein